MNDTTTTGGPGAGRGGAEGDAIGGVGPPIPSELEELRAGEWVTERSGPPPPTAPGARPAGERVPVRPHSLVIFDCDGVLVDSERIAVRIECRRVTELGWPMTERKSSSDSGPDR